MLSVTGFAAMASVDDGVRRTKGTIDFRHEATNDIVIASLRGEYRAKMVLHTMRSSCRAPASRRVQTFVLTSGARFDDDAPGRAGHRAPSAREAPPARLSKQRGDGPKYEHGAETPQKIRSSIQRRCRSLRASTW